MNAVGWNMYVFGKVQGVGFRAMVTEKARLLGLRGAVKNRVDGSVHIVAVGSVEDIKEFILWIKDNPGTIKVERLKEQPYQKRKTFKDFTILY